MSTEEEQNDEDLMMNMMFKLYESQNDEMVELEQNDYIYQMMDNFVITRGQLKNNTDYKIECIVQTDSYLGKKEL